MASLEVLPLASRGKSNDNGMFLSQVEERDRKRYFRVDDDGKANMTAPAEAATWFRLVSVPLENDVAHPGALGDEIGVATLWQLPGVFAGNPPDAFQAFQLAHDRFGEAAERPLLEFVGDSAHREITGQPHGRRCPMQSPPLAAQFEDRRGGKRLRLSSTNKGKSVTLARRSH